MFERSQTTRDESVDLMVELRERERIFGKCVTFGN